MRACWGCQRGPRYVAAPEGRYPAVEVKSSVGGGRERSAVVVLGFSFILELLMTKVLNTVVKLSQRCHTGRTNCHARFLMSLKDTLVVVMSRCNFRRVVGRDDIALSPDHITTRMIDNVKFVNTNAVVFRGRVIEKLAATTKV